MGIRFRRYIDEATGDYVVENGDFKESRGIAATVILTMRTRRGSCPVAPTWGSRLHEIQRLDSNAPRRAETLTAEALKFLVERGDIRDLKPRASVVSSTLFVDINYTDVTGQPRSVRFFYQVQG